MANEQPPKSKKRNKANARRGGVEVTRNRRREMEGYSNRLLRKIGLSIDLAHQRLSGQPVTRAGVTPEAECQCQCKRWIRKPQPEPEPWLPLGYVEFQRRWPHLAGKVGIPKIKRPKPILDEHEW